MRIAMILGDTTFPPDIRVEKEASALMVAGFDVDLLCSDYIPLAMKDEPIPLGLNVVRVHTYPVGLTTPHYWEEPKRPWLGGVVRAITNPRKAKPDWESLLGIDWLRFLRGRQFPRWRTSILKYLRESRPDVLHVHDFLLVPTVVSVASRHGLPVVADLHENWPAQTETARPTLSRSEQVTFDRFWNRKRCERLEKKFLPMCKAVIIVAQEAALRLRGYGIPDQNIHVVSNTEDDSTFDVTVRCPSIVDKYASRWVVSYIGNIGYVRGLGVIVEAIPEIVRHCDDFLFLVVGARKADQEELEQQAVELGVRKNVEIIGWQPKEKLSSFIAASKACLVPHRRHEHTDTTIPHKLFQYMLMGRPVIVSNCPPLRRVVEEAKCGVVFDPEDTKSAARAILSLYEDSAFAEQSAANGRSAALESFSWKRDAARLVGLYRGMNENPAVAG